MSDMSRIALGLVAAGAGAAFLTPGTTPLKAPATPSLRGTTSSSTGPGVTTVAVASCAVAALAATRGKATKRAAKVVRQQAPPAVAERKTTDLSGALPDCPATVWNADDIDIKKLPKVKETAPLIIDAAELGEELKKGTEKEWITAQKDKIMSQLQAHGAIWFRNFESTKQPDGFREFYEALQLNPCLDPIHTSGLRAMEEKKHAVYEAVNKPSLAGHFVGLHNESTFVKTATYGAFVCFKQASEGGGEFLIADGAKILEDMDPEVLERIYTNKVRISVSNLDLNFLGSLPEGMKESASDFLQDLIFKVVAPKFDMDLEMVYGADQSNPYRLQAIEHAQSPINKHPVTGQPVWFCNLHNHSRYLRDRRPCTVPEVGMTDVTWRLMPSKGQVYSGDLSAIPYDDVRHINEVCEKNIKVMAMKEGDVVLLDNYRVLHGRNTFKGDRKHAVTWFESCGEPLEGNQKQKPDDFMNELINKTLV